MIGLCHGRDPHAVLLRLSQVHCESVALCRMQCIDRQAEAELSDPVRVARLAATLLSLLLSDAGHVGLRFPHENESTWLPES